MSELLPLQTRVTHYGGGEGTHGFGTIIGVNEKQSIPYIENNFKDAVDMAAQAGVLEAIIDGFYPGDRYPYVVQWDLGHRDVYSPDNLRLAMFADQPILKPLPVKN